MTPRRPADNAMPQRPTIGRMVHYVPHTPNGDGQCRAAIITNVNPPDSLEPEVVSLAVLYPTPGLLFDHGVPHNEEMYTGGTWHWPEPT